MNTCQRLIGCLLTAILLSGCANARYVSRDAERGVIAISNASDVHMEKAHELMQQHFPEGYVIDREGEEIVGVETRVSKPSETMESAVTKDKTEWRIHYRRKDARPLVNSRSTSHSVQTASYGPGNEATRRTK